MLLFILIFSSQKQKSRVENRLPMQYNRKRRAAMQNAAHSYGSASSHCMMTVASLFGVAPKKQTQPSAVFFGGSAFRRDDGIG